MPLGVLAQLGLEKDPRYLPATAPGAKVGTVVNPATGAPIASIKLDDEATYERTINESVEAFKRWREVPAPERGQVVRAIGDEFRKHKAELGELVSMEVGKIRQEGLGEVQETIDIADFAVGLSRQLYGLTMPSERPAHRMFEQWLPLGPIGVISAFNFPNAVWAWNAMLAAVCGDTIIWKPSLMAPLTAMASNAIADRVATSMGHPNVFKLVIGNDDVIGKRLVADHRLPLISATGSTRMGKAVGQVVAARLGRALLELGGNNAIVVHKDADLKVAIPSIVFGSIGTAGQRCTTTRRLIVHESIVDDVGRARCRLQDRPNRRPPQERHARRPPDQRPRHRRFPRCDHDREAAGRHPHLRRPAGQGRWAFRPLRRAHHHPGACE